MVGGLGLLFVENRHGTADGMLGGGNAKYTKCQDVGFSKIANTFAESNQDITLTPALVLVSRTVEIDRVNVMVFLELNIGDLQRALSRLSSNHPQARERRPYTPKTFPA